MPANFCLLPAAFCCVLAPCCLLPAACYLLPAASCWLLMQCSGVQCMSERDASLNALPTCYHL
jgi:hypothetical protein